MNQPEPSKQRQPGTRRVWLARLVGVVIGAVLCAVSLHGTHRWSFGGSGCGTHAGLVVATGEDVSTGGQLQRLINRSNRQVAVRTLSPVADQVHSQLGAALGSGSCAYDVVNLDVEWVKEFASRKFIDRFPEHDLGHRSDFSSTPLRSGRVGHALYAVPYNTDAGLIYYRKDLLKAAGLHPQRVWDWNTLRKYARSTVASKQAKRQDPDLEAGFTTQLAGYEGLTVNAYESVHGAGADGFEAGLYARRGLNNLIDGLADGWIDRDALHSHEADDIDAFADGRVAMMRNWPYVYDVLAGDPRMKDDKGNDRFGVAVLQDATVLGGQSLAVPASSRHKAAARKLIDFLTSRSSEQQLFACGGFAPTRKSAYHYMKALTDKQFKQKCHAVVDQAGDQKSPRLTQAERGDIAGVTQQAVDDARPRPKLAHYTDYSATLQCYLHTALDRRMSFNSERYDRLTEALAAARRGHYVPCRSSD